MHGVADRVLQSSTGGEVRKRRRRSKPLPRGPFDRRTRLGRRRDALVAMFTAQLAGEVPPALVVKIATAAELVALAERYRASFMRGAALVPLDDLVRLERLAAGAVRGLHLDRHRPQPGGPTLRRHHAGGAAMTPLAIDKVLTDPRLLGAGLGDPATWSTWMMVLKAAFGLPLSDEERATFMAVAGGRVLPLNRVRELYCIAGRRSGKSRMAAALACYFALFVKHKLAGGERGMVLVLAATIEQAHCFRLHDGFPQQQSGVAEGDCQHDALRDQVEERHRHCGASQQLPQCAWSHLVCLHL